MKRLYLFPLCLTLLYWGCQPKDPLPRATQFGANTFGCKINGKTYIPDGGGSFSGLKPVEGGLSVISTNPVIRGIYIRTYASTGERLQIYLSDYKPGIYTLSDDTRPFPANTYPYHYAFYQAGKGGTVYITSSTCTGTVKINKADTLTGIVAGTFSLSPCSTISGPDQAATITEGRFDVKTF